MSIFGRILPTDPMLDSKGRVWMTSKIGRMLLELSWCNDGSNPYMGSGNRFAIAPPGFLLGPKRRK